jgi:hypothetical protein
MLHLRRRGGDVLLSGDLEFLGPRPRHGSPGAAVIADIVDRVVHNDRLGVDVRDIHVNDIVDGAIIKEVAVIPVSAFIASAGVAKSIDYAAVEPDTRSPIPCVKPVNAVVPAPVSGCPEQAWSRREHPSARDPIIVAAVPCPISRSPKIARRRNRRLFVNRQGRRREGHLGVDDHLCIDSGRKRRHNAHAQRHNAHAQHKSQSQGTKKAHGKSSFRIKVEKLMHYRFPHFIGLTWCDGSSKSRNGSIGSCLIILPGRLSHLRDTPKFINPLFAPAAFPGEEFR